MSEEYIISKKADIVGIANAIRSKNGNSDGIALDNMASLIEGIKTNGMDENILSLFGATDYEIVENVTGTSYDDKYLWFKLTNKITDCNDIKFVFCVYNEYLTGISLAIPEATASDNYMLHFSSAFLNGICPSMITYIKTSTNTIHTNSGNTNGGNSGFSYRIFNNENNTIGITNLISGVLYNLYTAQPYTALIIYNKSGE